MASFNDYSTTAEISDWVPETRFGTWFQSQWIWTDYVLGPALKELQLMLAERRGPFHRIVDAGCGIGHSFSMLADAFSPDEIFGIEIDLNSVEAARQKTTAVNCPVQVCHGSVEHIPLPDESVDMIFCHQTIHHVVDQVKAVREFSRILEPGGILLLSESCRSFIDRMIIRALFRHPNQKAQAADGFIWLLRQGGFNVADQDISYPQPFWADADFGLTRSIGLTNRISTHKKILNCISIKKTP